MKKLIAVLLSAGVVLGCLHVGILWSAADGESHRSGFYYDFSNSDSYAMLTDVSVDGTRTYETKPMYIPGAARGSFDATYRAAKIYSHTGDSARRNPTLWVGCSVDEYTADMATHTVLAMKVKLTNPATATLGAVKMMVHGSAMGHLNLSERQTEMALPTVPQYKNTTDWQLVLIDLSPNNYSDQMRAIANDVTAFGTTASWFMTTIELSTYGDTNPIYVQWAGVFENAEQARANYIATTDAADLTPDFNEGGSLPNSQIKNLGAQLRESDKALRFGFRIAAGNVSYEAGSFAQAEESNYYVRNDLTQSKATMVIGGVERPIVDFGAIVTVKEDAQADDLTAENVKVADSGIKAISGRKLYYVTGNRIDYVVTITNANKYADKPIYARVYVAYQDDGGVTRYTYGDMISRKVNDLLEESAEFTVTPSMTIQQSAAAVTNQNATEWSPLSVTYTALSSYDPSWQYVHHPGLAVFKGKLYASFSRGRAYEDTPGQHVVIRSVDLDKTTTASAWSPLTTVATSQFGSTHGFCLNGYLYATEDVLFCYYMDKALSEAWVSKHAGESDAVKYAHKRNSDDYFENVDRNRGMVIYTTDGIHWSKPQNVGFAANESPRQSLTGQWFTGSGNQLLYSADKTPLGAAWSNVGRYAGKTKEDIKNDVADGWGESRAKLTEASWYQTDDKVIHHMLRSDTGYVWMSESYDNGKTWTASYPTNFTSDTTMAKFGRLSNEEGSLYYFIGSPTCNGSRDPLALYTSEDGYNFDKKYILRQSGSYTMQSDNWTKVGACAYPEALIHDGYMYVIHSEYKEIMSITRIALSAIE